MSLEDQLKGLKEPQLTQLAHVAVMSDNLTILKAIDKQNKKILLKNSEFQKDLSNTFNACRYGSASTLSFLESKGVDFKITEPSTGNTCQHLASIAGNIALLEEMTSKRKNQFSMNVQNNLLETPLHVTLKYGEYKYEKTAVLLSRFSDLLLKDSEGKEPHRIRMKNFKQNVRLSEFLSQKYLKLKARQQQQSLTVIDQSSSQ